MKKSILILGGLFAAAILMTGCGNTATTTGGSSAALSGTWEGVGNALGEDEEFNCDYLNLSITKEGAFSFEDVTQGSTILSGTLSVDSKEKISIAEANASQESTSTLPAGWDGFEESSSLTYTMPDTDSLVLTCNDTSYFFKKQKTESDRAEEDTEGGSASSPLLHLSENDVWYSNDGSITADTTYEIALYDDYMELYSISPQKEATFLTNFMYLSNEESTFTFYTCRKEDAALPEALADLPEGFQTVKMDLTAENDSLTLTYGGNSLAFYNNVVYGLETDSDAYSLCDTCFNWVFDKKDHFSYFTMHPETDSLYLYVTDGKEDAADPKIVCGEVEVDEKAKTITYHFDGKTSRETAKKEDALYKTFKKLDGTVLPYTFENAALSFSVNGTPYSFQLEQY